MTRPDPPEHVARGEVIAPVMTETGIVGRHRDGALGYMLRLTGADRAAMAAGRTVRHTYVMPGSSWANLCTDALTVADQPECREVMVAALADLHVRGGADLAALRALLGDALVRAQTGR